MLQPNSKQGKCSFYSADNKNNSIFNKQTVIVIELLKKSMMLITVECSLVITWGLVFCMYSTPFNFCMMLNKTAKTAPPK